MLKLHAERRIRVWVRVSVIAKAVFWVRVGKLGLGLGIGLGIMH